MNPLPGPRGRSLMRIFLMSLLLAAVVSVAPRAMAQDYTLDRSASDALTDYLRTHRLPLVGASVSRAASGNVRVMLYGYVATRRGKRNAAHRVAVYFHHDSRVTIVNRISINPEIRKLGSNGSAAPGPPAASTGSSNGLTWDRVMREIQEYGIHPAPDPGSATSAPW